MTTKKEKIVVTKDQIDFSGDELKIVADSTDYLANAPKFHKEFEIKYCYEGCFNVIVNSEVYTVNPGDIVIINPYEIHENPKDYMSRGKYYLLMFDLDIFDKGSVGRELYSQGKKLQHLIQNHALMQELIVLIVKELKEKKKSRTWGSPLTSREISRVKKDLWGLGAACSNWSAAGRTE